jgi:xanthine dehydrogenase accessory factor
MSILIDADPKKHLAVFIEIEKAQKTRLHGILVTFYEAEINRKATISRYWFTKQQLVEQSINLPTEVTKVVSQMSENAVPGDFREIDISNTESFAQAKVFLETITPPPMLLIAGAGHVGKALSKLGALLDFEVVVWDSRPDFATAKNLPEAHQIFSGDIALMKNRLAFGKNTCVVIVTHGHETDAEVLKAFIQEDVAYIGMMGSRRKIAQIRQLFFENGWATDDQWKRVYTPVGIEIGSKTVNEIAISIAAQLVQVRNGKRKGD